MDRTARQYIDQLKTNLGQTDRQIIDQGRVGTLPLWANIREVFVVKSKNHDGTELWNDLLTINGYRAAVEIKLDVPILDLLARDSVIEVDELNGVTHDGTTLQVVPLAKAGEVMAADLCYPNPIPPNMQARENLKVFRLGFSDLFAYQEDVEALVAELKNSPILLKPVEQQSQETEKEMAERLKNDKLPLEIIARQLIEAFPLITNQTLGRLIEPDPQVSSSGYKKRGKKWREATSEGRL